jgi:outer membrane protein OmpA-like peptidoglycan-associated protein
MFMITGYTDIVGDPEYNVNLSRARAESVTRALIERGVPPQELRFVGIGSRAAHALVSDPVEVRASDRKVTIEPITNRRYWERLPRHNLTR